MGGGGGFVAEVLVMPGTVTPLFWGGFVVFGAGDWDGHATFATSEEFGLSAGFGGAEKEGGGVRAKMGVIAVAIAVETPAVIIFRPQ